MEGRSRFLPEYRLPRGKFRNRIIGVLAAGAVTLAAVAGVNYAANKFQETIAPPKYEGVHLPVPHYDGPVTNVELLRGEQLVDSETAYQTGQARIEKTELNVVTE